MISNSDRLNAAPPPAAPVGLARVGNEAWARPGPPSEGASGTAGWIVGPGEARFLGIDLGAETVKVVELRRGAEGLVWSRRWRFEHAKRPGPALVELLEGLDWGAVTAATVTGRLARAVNLPRVPTKQALARACRFLHGETPITAVSIGSHGFCVLELRANGVERFRENSRCSQGTGNFLRQLTERFGLGVEEASALCSECTDPAPLSGRCPVILKTDMTHLANKGEDRARILAGLFDAVSANVLTLIKPRSSPPRVVLIGGVSQSLRVRRACERFCEAAGLEFQPGASDDALYYDALGSALVAAESGPPTEGSLPGLGELISPAGELHLEQLPSLSAFLPKVRRLPARAVALPNGRSGRLILGFDIGSTGSKAVALDAESAEVLWQGYRRTGGDPVGAARALVQRFRAEAAGGLPVVILGVTGSGREIVGSLLRSCYGSEVVYVLNEIVAHAEGALHYDPRVDTIFEIGGQDAKYIRLLDGRVIDCAMNEACSAGTGSFIEEQGGKFAGLEDVRQLARVALAAPAGVSLGQHCSVFMAEVIDEAVAAGVERDAIIAGLYDSIIQNYLNRVKGCRSVGQVVFCQGMPFASDALAAAVARQTGSVVVVPPDPGTVGALGIGLLARRELSGSGRTPLDLDRFLEARVENKETFTCRATVGCGGGGNHCRIDSLKTVVGGRRQVFNWGGACSLYDKGVQRVKLPDRAPDPFREREELVRTAIAGVASPTAGPSVALTDEFALKGLFPFFHAYLAALGAQPIWVSNGDPETLRRGVREANVPFCAPMQLFHGLLDRMAETGADWLFVPMLRSLPRSDGEPLAKTCPIVQASADLGRWTLREADRPRLLSPVLEVGAGNLDSAEFREGCRRLARQLGVSGARARRAWTTAKAVQERFDLECSAIGERALAFCAERGVIPVVVLGRPYTIYNRVLNSNVPALLREQGAMAIPTDCYPVAAETPVCRDMYWGYGQRILRAAHQVRRAPGVYALYASNYSCGPDSFNLHFCSHLMEGKPFAIIETDGHAGDAGTKTRVEAFLHCVREDRRRTPDASAAPELAALDGMSTSSSAIRERGETLLIPRMGYVSETIAACFRGLGLRAECLPAPDREALRLGRRYTSGKECLPMCVTLGSLLQRVQAAGADERFSFLMPRAEGPCRFGVYNVLHRLVLDRLGLGDRVRVWSPCDANYFEGLPAGFNSFVFAATMASDLLQEALLDVRPVERRRGAAAAWHARQHEALLAHLEREARGDLSMPAALWQAINGRLFGLRERLTEVAEGFAVLREARPMPTVLVVGEIYVRLDPFSNNHVIDQLEARGLRVRLASCNEWLEYVEHHNCGLAGAGLSQRLTTIVLQRIQEAAYAAVAGPLGWPARLRVQESLAAAEPYIRSALSGEAVLTVGGPLHEWRRGQIDGVVSVGPLECMPNKIAEAQFHPVADREGLLSLTLSLNGEPIPPEVLDNFAFEVHARFAGRASASPVRESPKNGSTSEPGLPVPCAGSAERPMVGGGAGACKAAHARRAGG